MDMLFVIFKLGALKDWWGSYGGGNKVPNRLHSQGFGGAIFLRLLLVFLGGFMSVQSFEAQGRKMGKPTTRKPTVPEPHRIPLRHHCRGLPELY